MYTTEKSTSCLNIFDLAGVSCVIDAGTGVSIHDVKLDAARQLCIGQGGHLTLLHGCTELMDSEPLPPGDLNLLLIHRPRPQSWEYWINEVCENPPAIDRMNIEVPEILQFFGVDFANEVIEKDSGAVEVFRCLPKELREHRHIAMAAVLKNGALLAHTGKRLRNDRNVVLAAVRQTRTGCTCCVPLPIQYASEELLNDPDILLEAMAWEPQSSYFVSNKGAANIESRYGLRYVELRGQIETGVTWSIETDLEGAVYDQEEEYMSKLSHARVNRRNTGKQSRRYKVLRAGMLKS